MSEDNTQESNVDKKYQERKVKPTGDPKEATVVQKGTATNTKETPIVDGSLDLSKGSDGTSPAKERVLNEGEEPKEAVTDEVADEEVQNEVVDQEAEAVTGEGSEGEADVAGDTAEETTTEDPAVEGSEDQGSDETEETAQTA